MTARAAEAVPVQHRGTAIFKRVLHGRGNRKTAEFEAALPQLRGHPRHENGVGARLLIRFKGRQYPFEGHYLYARHRGPLYPYTFANMVFEPAPAPAPADRPGALRVGPWPGWRGVPSFPEIRLSIGEVDVPVVFTPWGDELKDRSIRGVATFPGLPRGVIVCKTSDLRLVPVKADLYLCRLPGAGPVRTALLPSLVGKHPRLLLSEHQLAPVHEKARGTHARLWERIVGLLEAPSLPWETTPESKTLPGPERLSPEDRALLAACASLVDPTHARRKDAKDSLRTLLDVVRRPGYSPLTIDTQAGETLFILCVCFDWTYNDWLPNERASIREILWHVAEICWSFLGYDRRDIAQAHYLGCGLGLLAFSLLFWEEHPRAQEWAAYFRGVLDQVLTMLPEDGFYPHGINLWIYEYGFLLRWAELFRSCTENDPWALSAHWAAASRFRACATTPDGLSAVTFGDPQFRVGGDSWCHYLVAARTRASLAQELGDLLVDQPTAGVDFRQVPPRRRVYELLFHDPAGTGDEPARASTPRVDVFADGGQLFVRGGGDAPSLFTFRAGPPLGRRRYAAGEHGGYGHADPSNGSFLLYANGSLAVTGPGPTYRRDTSTHNTLTIDGQGQIGDSTVWLPDFIPPEALCPTARFQQHPGGVAVAADLSPAYLPHLGVKKCLRSLWIDPGRYIAGLDTLRCSGMHTLQWNLHASSLPLLRDQGKAHEFHLRCAAPSSMPLRLFLLWPEDAEFETGLMPMVPAYPHDGTRIWYLRCSVRRSAAHFLWVLMIDPGAAAPELCNVRGARDTRKRPTLALRCGIGHRLVAHNDLLLPEEAL